MTRLFRRKTREKLKTQQLERQIQEGQTLENKIFREYAPAEFADRASEWVSAHHEAAHAVVGEIYDFPVKHVSIKGGFHKINGFEGITSGGCQMQTSVDGFVHIQGPFREEMYLREGLAGMAAEHRLGIPASKISPGDIIAIGPSVKKLAQLARIDPKDFVTASIGYVQSLISQSDVWQSIEELAKLLLSEKVVTGKEVRAIVDKHVNPATKVSELSQLQMAVQHFSSEERQRLRESSDRVRELEHRIAELEGFAGLKVA